MHRPTPAETCREINLRPRGSVSFDCRNHRAGRDCPTCGPRARLPWEDPRPENVAGEAR